MAGGAAGFAGRAGDAPRPPNIETEEDVMAWKTPKVAEVALGGEINSYVCAKLK